MKTSYQPLSVVAVTKGITFVEPTQILPDRVTSESPAIDAMTDLARVAAVTIGPNLPLAAAEECMRVRGVRMLLVTGAMNEILGLITLKDIKGERPVKFQRSMGVGHHEILVRDVMTPREKLEALRMKDVQVAKVGAIIATLSHTGRQHALVIERTVRGDAIRGIFSSTHIGRQLGVTLENSGVAYSFAELEDALLH